MRQPPPLTEAGRFPVSGGICLLSVVVSLMFWTKHDVSLLTMNFRAFGSQPWRLVSCVLPHANAIHLIFNLYWVWLLGTLIESRLGSVRFFGLVILLAAGAAAPEYAFATGGIGLSGVGYGLLGFAWARGRVDPQFADAADKQTVQLFVGWFFVCIITTILHVMPVANISHGVGAVLGLLAGFAVAAPRRSIRILSATSIAAMLILMFPAGTVARPWLNFSNDAGLDLAQAGVQALQADDKPKAINLFRRAVKYRHPAAAWWFDLGLAYGRNGNYVEQLQAYERSIAIDPLSKDVKGWDLATLGADALGKGDAARAANLLDRAVKAGRTDSSTKRLLAQAYQRSGQTKLAYQTLAEIDVRDKPATQAAADHATANATTQSANGEP